MQTTRQLAALALATVFVHGACGAKHAAPEVSEKNSHGGQGGYGEFVEVGATSIALHHVESANQAEFVLITAKGRAFMHADGSPLALATTFAAHLVDVQDEAVWLASFDKLARVRPGSESEPAIALPAGARSSAIEVGFDGSVFVADAEANRIYRVQAKEVEVLAEGPSLAHPRALQLNGGSLVVGGDAGVYTISLATGERSEVARIAGGVVGLALDHLGYLVIADDSGSISQVRSDGSSKLLHKGPGGIESIAFDETRRVLYVATAEKTSKMRYLELTGEDAVLWNDRDRRPMRAIAKNEMILSGAEYWPSRGMTKVVYPDDILWGFYPAPEQVFEGSAAARAPTKAAVRCAEQSYKALMAFFDAKPAAFHEAAGRPGISNRFYLWVNDYSETDADFPHELRMNKFWYWQRDPAVKGRVPGFFGSGRPHYCAMEPACGRSPIR